MLMASPPLPYKDLQGASRTHGGIFRGRAHGNQHNIEDYLDLRDDPLPIPGKVHVYVSTRCPCFVREMSPMQIKILCRS